MVLALGYDCQTGHETTQAYVHSYVPSSQYVGGHIAPLVQVLRKGQGVAIPIANISISHHQPLKIR